MQDTPLKHRDVNWLYFNERVLLEAANTSTPLLERLKFLAIFSSNLDEYFKVRIAQLRQLKGVDKSLRKKLVLKPNKKLKFILKTVKAQQERFGKVITEVFEALEKEGVVLLKPEDITEEQRNFLRAYFVEKVQESCEVVDIIKAHEVDDGQLYLVADITDNDFDTVNIPVKTCGRFIALPGEQHYYVYLDDVLKLNVDRLFPNKTTRGLYTVKLSRDAELYLEDEFTDHELVDKIYQSLGKRAVGQPTRLLYDSTMPSALQNNIKKELGLGEADMLAGGAYHNLSDLFAFPQPSDKEQLQYGSMLPLPHPVLSKTNAIFKEIEEKDQLVHFPYQQFAAVEGFLEAAATTADVTSIKMSLYRIAKTSALTDSILKALKNGKKVVLFVEAQARFDEANNIKWGRVFQEHGATVLFSVPNIKVHSKILLVERGTPSETKRYAYIGTGNFNAKTAKLYCDHGLFTAHTGITKELAQVFDVLERKLIIPKLKHLLVAPFTARNSFLKLIENEIDHANKGKPAKITAKMNSLEDTVMIKALYRASEAGVVVRLLVRGICCLVPKPKSELLSGEKPIYVTSIIDRYLEHGRIYHFENGGDPKMYMGSADWMTRNLDRRIEVLTPILDTDVFKELKIILNLQLQDNCKARIVDAENSNQKVERHDGQPEIRSQYAIYNHLKEVLHETN